MFFCVFRGRNAYQRKIACEVDYHWFYWAVREEEKMQLTSVQCEGIEKNFFLHFFEENEIFHLIPFFVFFAHILGQYEYFFLKLYLLMYFFLFFGIRLCIFCNNLVFTICPYSNYMYVLFFQILTFLKLCLVFAKLLKNQEIADEVN